METTNTKPSAELLAAVRKEMTTASFGTNSQIGKFLDFTKWTKEQFVTDALVLVPTDMKAPKPKIIGGVQVYGKDEKIQVLSFSDGTNTMSIALIQRGEIRDAGDNIIEADATKDVIESFADILVGHKLTATGTDFDMTDMRMVRGELQGRKFYKFLLS